MERSGDWGMEPKEDRGSVGYNAYSPASKVSGGSGRPKVTYWHTHDWIDHGVQMEACIFRGQNGRLAQCARTMNDPSTGGRQWGGRGAMDLQMQAGRKLGKVNRLTHCLRMGEGWRGNRPRMVTGLLPSAAIDPGWPIVLSCVCLHGKGGGGDLPYPFQLTLAQAMHRASSFRVMCRGEILPSTAPQWAEVPNRDEQRKKMSEFRFIWIYMNKFIYMNSDQKN